MSSLEVSQFLLDNKIRSKEMIKPLFLEFAESFDVSSSCKLDKNYKFVKVAPWNICSGISISSPIFLRCFHEMEKSEGIAEMSNGEFKRRVICYFMETVLPRFPSFARIIWNQSFSEYKTVGPKIVLVDFQRRMIEIMEEAFADLNLKFDDDSSDQQIDKLIPGFHSMTKNSQQAEIRKMLKSLRNDVKLLKSYQVLA